MRIYLSCLQSRVRHPVPAYAFWERYFKRGIEEGGHAWLETPGVDWAEGLVYATGGPGLDAWLDRTWMAVLDHLRRELARGPVDFFLGYLYPHQVSRDAVEQIRAMGVPCVNFFCDNVREFAAVPAEYAPFDLHWVPENKAMPLYARAGLPAVNLPMPTWVDPALRTCAHEERHGPTFIGSRDVQRERLFTQVLALGGDVELRGPGWETGPGTEASGTAAGSRRELATVLRNQVDFARSQGTLALARKIGGRLKGRGAVPSFAGHVAPAAFDDAYFTVTQQCQVVIGVNRYPSYRHPEGRPDTYSRLRDIEAPMLGACYLTEWTEGLDALYDIGSEIETFASAEEMVEKIAALRADPQRRAGMRCAGQRRALADHSVARSIAAIGARLSLSGR